MFVTFSSHPATGPNPELIEPIVRSHTVFCSILSSYQFFVSPLIFSDKNVNAYFRSLLVVLVPWLRQHFGICAFYLIFSPLNI